MQAYIVLGTTGSGTRRIADEIQGLFPDRQVRLKEGKISATYEIDVPTPVDAKFVLDKAFAYLQKQPWYWDDSQLGFTASGALDSDGTEWHCPEDGADMNKHLDNEEAQECKVVLPL